MMILFSFDTGVHGWHLLGFEQTLRLCLHCTYMSIHIANILFKAMSETDSVYEQGYEQDSDSTVEVDVLRWSIAVRQ